nr:sperm activating peptide III [Clypeaster japonicus]
SDSAHLIG